MRADQFLFTHGLARSRTHAATLIGSGVYIKDKRIEKASAVIPDDTPADAVRIVDPSRYVSRGGLKLEEAFSAFGLNAEGLTVLDIGASTGGFTDCLLKHGAARVYALDVGHGQLAPSLASDPRVVNMEGINARAMTPELFPAAPDMAVTDVSFISQTLLFPAVSLVLPDHALFVSLVKPQFEAGKAAIGKNGIVGDRKVHETVLKAVITAAADAGLAARGLCPSPITGGDGNIEYLALFEKKGEPASIPFSYESVVSSAFAGKTEKSKQKKRQR